MELFVVVVFLKQTYLKLETSFGTNIPEIPIRSESMFFSFSVTLSNPAEKVAYLIIFHILFVLFVWTYWKSIFTLPVQPGKKYHMSYADKERYENEERPEVQRQILAEIARKLPVYTRTGSGGIRFCDRCQLIKPDRCHHCSVCAMCVLKMDHHCPWVNNCIGFSNYKFFLLFLAYSLLYCLYIAATVFKYFIKYWTGELTNGRSKFHILFLLFLAVMFFVSLMFLFGYHCWLVSRNRSTLEAFSTPVFQNGPDKNGFNLGFVKNLQQVFGEEKKLWLLPIASSDFVAWLLLHIAVKTPASTVCANPVHKKPGSESFLPGKCTAQGV
ncbi:palmitoyltransferase ZDHHC15 isoform X3 [Lagopus muta]|uniref:palmitoyltransferase ZDHHC15 isoform X3 n=1 Tax=Lagopus muta TaxID=64668 RepID=UPI0020A11B8D|nr:palmitoyltransferase ZDHHC15 isoform X3 [Lagopus muta]